MTVRGRLARNQQLFREVNEHIRRLEEGWESVDPRSQFTFVCECPSIGCRTALEATLNEYHEVRLRATEFLVAPGHADPGRDRVVRVTDRFTVVEPLAPALPADAEGAWLRRDLLQGENVSKTVG